MAFNFNNNSVTSVNFNGNTVNTVNLNGVEVWSSAPQPIPNYFYIDFIDSGYLRMTSNNGWNGNKNIQYSTDGTTWTSTTAYALTQAGVPFNAGTRVYLKSSDKNGFADHTQNFDTYWPMNKFYKFTIRDGNDSDIRYSVGGELVTLFNGDMIYNGSCEALFAQSNCQSCQYLVLPDYTKPWCYHNMFGEDRNMHTVLPELPAETIADYAYYAMFGNSGIITPPVCKAKKAGEKSFGEMFVTSFDIHTPMDISGVQEFGDNCCFFMYMNCNLSYAPQINAVNVGDSALSFGMSGVSLSTTKDSTYQYPYMIRVMNEAGTTPTAGFLNGQSDPSINVQYYSNVPVIPSGPEYFWIEPINTATLSFGRVGGDSSEEWPCSKVIYYSTDKVNWTQTTVDEIMQDNPITLTGGQKTYFKSSDTEPFKAEGEEEVWDGDPEHDPEMVQTFTQYGFDVNGYYKIGGDISTLFNEETIDSGACTQLFTGQSTLYSIADIRIYRIDTGWSALDSMFEGCSNIYVSLTKTFLCDTPIRFPFVGQNAGSKVGEYTFLGTGTGSPEYEATIALANRLYWVNSKQIEDCFWVRPNLDAGTLKLERKIDPENVYRKDLNKNISYKIDDGQWTPISENDFLNTGISVNKRQKIYLKSSTSTAFDLFYTVAISPYPTYETSYGFKFVDGVTWSIGGDIASLFNYQSIPTNALAHVFKDGLGLIDARLLKLPNTVPTYAFFGMFSGCTGLQYAPQFLPASTIGDKGYAAMFYGCTQLFYGPQIMATSTTGSNTSYNLSQMFDGCRYLTTLPKLFIETLTDRCYSSMFSGCSNIMLSTTQVGDYQTAYTIPFTGTGTSGTNSLTNMFNNTGGTFTSDPTVNTTYYTSNKVI